MVTAAAALTVSEALSGAQEFNRLPYFCKWVSSDEAVFSYDGSYTDDEAFLVAFPSHAVEKGVKSPEKFRDFPLKPEGAVNITFSPDSSMLAFNRDNVSAEFVFREICLYSILNLFFCFFYVHFSAFAFCLSTARL